MIKSIIFDLDGTLANTIEDITDGLNGMLNELGFSTVTVAQTLENINNGALELVRRSLPEDKRDDGFARYAKTVYEKYYAKCYNCKTYADKGVTEALKELALQGITLCVLSNKQDPFVKEIVKKLFADVPFAYVCGQSDRFPTKPDPTSVNYIMSKLGVSPDECAFVGDSGVDIKTAKNASLHPVGVSWGYRSVDVLNDEGAALIINNTASLSEIPNLLI